MTTKDIICLTLGIGTAFNTHDDIVDNFDVEIDCDDVEQLLDECSGDYSNFSTMLSERLLSSVLKEYGIELYENGWNADINGDVVRLYYNNEIIANRSEIEDIVNNAFNDAKFTPERSGCQHLFFALFVDIFFHWL